MALIAAAQISCGGNCGRERESAIRLIEKARAAHADSYAEETFRKATDLAARADSECHLQEERFYLSRSFAVPRRLYREALAEAGKAIREGSVNEGMAHQEALNARYLAVQSVEGARSAVLRVRKVRGAAAVPDLEERMGRLRQALSEVQGRIDQGKYLAARDLGNRIVQESIQLEALANRRTLGLPPATGGTDRLY